MISRGESARPPGHLILSPCCRGPSADVVRANYTHEEIVLPIIKKPHEQFPPSPTASTPSLPSSPSVSHTPSVKTQPAPLSPPKSKTSVRVPAPRLDPYSPAYGTRVAIKLEEMVGRRGRTPPTPSSPGFSGGDMLGALLTSSYKNKEEGKKSKDGKKEKVMPKVIMTPF